MRLLLSLFLSSLAFAGLASAQSAPAAPAAPAAQPEKPVLLGALTREQVEAAVPDWVQAEVESTPDAATVQALAGSGVAPGAEVTIYMGTWCGDSRREVARLWRVLDEAGGSLPCKVSYIGVDRDKKEPAALVAGVGLLYVPTLVVRRDGREVGRIVESSPHGIEVDLLALVSGSAHGVLSARPDLGEKKP